MSEWIQEQKRKNSHAIGAMVTEKHMAVIVRSNGLGRERGRGRVRCAKALENSLSEIPPHPVLKANSMPDIPFDWNVTTTKWTFGKHSYLVLEKTLSGYSMYGRVDGKPWDDNGEDFFFEDTDQLLTFLHKAKLLHVLSLPGASP